MTKLYCRSGAFKKTITAEDGLLGAYKAVIFAIEHGRKADLGYLMTMSTTGFEDENPMCIPTVPVLRSLGFKTKAARRDLKRTGITNTKAIAWLLGE